MKKTVIWDLDGTLIDSYQIIVSAIHNAISDYSTQYSKEDIYKHVKTESVESFFKMASKSINVDYQIIKDAFTEYFIRIKDAYQPMTHALEILEVLYKEGIDNYVYTHRGLTTYDILKKNHMMHFFKDIVTNHDGYKRKPDPEALNYLIHKYALDLSNTFYVGDRRIDVECAINAGVHSVFFNLDFPINVSSEYEIKDLLELQDILLGKTIL